MCVGRGVRQLRALGQRAETSGCVTNEESLSGRVGFYDKSLLYQSCSIGINNLTLLKL